MMADPIRRRELLGGVAERAGDAPARGRRRQRAAARRPGHAVGRSRRRQDHLRARPDPPSRRRRDDRGAEPDLHADADLRAAALSRGACRSLPASSGTAELAELGFDDLPEDAVVLLEWPDRAAGFLPPDRLDIALTLAPKLKLEFRHARVTGHGTFAPRVDADRARCAASSRSSGLGERSAHAMPGDASTRTYERLTLDDQHGHPDELAAPARTARRCATASPTARSRIWPRASFRSWPWPTGLREHGLLAPEILHADLEQGLLVIEDLGDERVVAGDPPAPIEERYETAVDRPGCAARSGVARPPAGRAASRISVCRPTTWRRS